MKLNVVQCLPDSSYNEQDFCDIVMLMANSSTHKNFTVSDLMRVVLPPVQLDQYKVFREQNKPVGFVSWAWLTSTSAFGYVTRQRRIQPSDWNTGNQLWIIDVIADGYSPIKIIRYLRDKFECVGGVEKAYWHTLKRPNKIGKKVSHV